MQLPRNGTLAEELYRNIDCNEYLQEIYASLLHNYSICLFDIDTPLQELNITHAVRFADILSKAANVENADKYKLWGQEIAILLNLIYPDNKTIKHYLGAVLSSVGNYRGLKSPSVGNFQSADILDRLYYSFDKDALLIPGKEDEYFFRDQKTVYDGLNYQYFSYSGPTSMGKSFVVQTYITQQIENGSSKNYAVLVPTKALINEVRSSLFKDLQTKLNETNYRVVSAAGDLVLQQDHHFIFVMTPERLLHVLIGMPKVKIDFLFIDEAHKISLRGGRSTYYYKVISQLLRLEQRPTIVFASPNIPNPEVYLNLIPGIQPEQIKKLASKYAPVCQFKYFIDVPSNKIYQHNDYTKTLSFLENIPCNYTLSDIITCVGQIKQNIIYCSSRQKVITYAVAYAKSLNPSDDAKLQTLAKEIRQEVHNDCYLADLITKGVAYHVGYLPANIRLRIEKAFEDGIIRTIFCTSTLVEGVNLPADNLFITSYRDGPANMDEVEFRNLIGRVGRIKYNLYGNVFLIRENDTLKEDRYISLLKRDVPPQELSINLTENTKQIQSVIESLADGDIELTDCLTNATGKEYDAMRKFALIYTRDIALGVDSPVKDIFSKYITQAKENQILQQFPLAKTNDDITFSYDQASNLHDAILSGAKYPELKGENDEVDFDELIEFLKMLKRVFKWNIYERETIGKSDAVLRWYAVILLRWIRGNGLSQIIYHAIDYKEKNPYTGVWVGKTKYAEFYDKNDKMHKNYVIAETLGVIENVLLFSISNYFRKFSLEYMNLHPEQVVNNHFTNDWYEYVEYGTTNPLTIFLQQNGFSREVSTFIEESKNRAKYLIEENGVIKIHRSIFECGNLGVETEAKDIQFNVPELFIE